MSWKLFQDNAWRIKTAGLGSVTGFDLDAARRRLVAGGIDLEIAEDLLAACEAGAVKGYSEKGDPDGGKD